LTGRKAGILLIEPATVNVNSDKPL